MEADVKLMREYIKKTIEEALKGMPPIDPKMFREVRQAEKSESRRGQSATVGEQYMAEKQQSANLVKENIRMRAELREQKMTQFPNIAKLLTGGGAGSPVGIMGQMQKRASKPFKAVHEYKQKEEELAGFDKAQPFGPLSPKKFKERGILEEEKEGLKKRAGSGFGAKIMGKRMSGMIGKVGKFMDSSKGQGMMAGGMMGASIFTMIIKKAMEASPMLQQMLKIMNVAMTLFLRPIGDFIGGMLKPIMMFFLREIAVPMLNKGKGMIKYGETFGKQVLGFLLKPVETIQAAIMGALGAFPGMSEISLIAQKFDGVKEWMTEQKMNVIAADLNYNNRDELSSAIDSGSLMEHGGMSKYTPVELKELVEQFKGMREDLNTNEYNYAGNYSYKGAAGGVAASMGLSVTQMDSISEATGRVVTELDLMAERLNPTTPKDKDIDIDGNVTITSTGGTTVGDGRDEMPDRDYSSIYGTEEENQPYWVTKLKHWSNAQVYNTPTKMLQAFQEQVRPMMTTGGVQDPKKLAEYNQMTAGGTRSVAEGIQAHFEKIERLTALMANEDVSMAKLNTDGLKLHTDDMLISTQQMVDNLNTGGEITKAMVLKMQAMMNSMSLSRMSGGLRGTGTQRFDYSGRPYEYQSVLNTDTGQTGVSYGPALPAFATKNADGSYSGGESLQSYGQRITGKVWKDQHGGMINEPIWGIGASGQGYMFGEAGPERVIPTGASSRMDGGGIGPVVINVNVDSINSDVDLEKIKPVIERALHEVHARRGII